MKIPFQKQEADCLPLFVAQLIESPFEYGHAGLSIITVPLVSVISEQSRRDSREIRQPAPAGMLKGGCVGGYM